MTSGKPNALETTIEEDRGKQSLQTQILFDMKCHLMILLQYKLLLGCSGTEGMKCGGPRYTGNTCCKGGYRCVQKTSTSRWMTCQPSMKAVKII